MSKCTDRQLGGMLHHYELGLLPDDQRLLFETHLLECEYCCEQLEEFRRVAVLMRTDADVREAVAQVDEALQAEVSAGAKPGFFWRRRFWSTLVPTAVAAVIFLLLVLKDWQFDIRPSQEAVAVENRLAVMYFDNLAAPGDPDRLGEIATHLLITDLAESHYLQVVSSQRLFDILKLLGHEESKVVDRDLATEVATRTRSRWMLQGSILRVEPNIEVAIELTDVGGGQVIAARQVSGAEGEDIFTVVDKITVALKDALALPESARQETDRQVADVTTHSPEAYRFYLEGLDNLSRLYRSEARDDFREALRYDSTMAMAYYYLAQLGDFPKIELAERYSDKVTRREKLYIESLTSFLAGDSLGWVEAWRKVLKEYPDSKDALMNIGHYHFGRREYREAVNYYQQVTRVAPLGKEAYNSLAYSYHFLGDADSAIWAANKYIVAAPGESNPYDTRGDLYAFNGKLDQAAESYRQALELKPDFLASLTKLGHMCVFKGDYRRADSCYDVLRKSGGPGDRASGRLFAAYIPLHQGKVREALKVTMENLRLDEADTAQGGRARTDKLCMAAILQTQLGDTAEGMRLISRCREINLDRNPEDFLRYSDIYVSMLIRTGQYKAADSVINALYEYLERFGATSDFARYVEALAAWERKDVERAVNLMDSTIGADRGEHWFLWEYTQARIYLDAGRLADAVALFEGVLNHYECYRLFYGLRDARIHYYLGLAYEKSSWFDKAAEQYELLITQWAEADTSMAELEDARERLARLRSMP